MPTPFNAQNTLIGAWSGDSVQGTSGIGTCHNSAVRGMKLEVHGGLGVPAKAFGTCGSLGGKSLGFGPAAFRSATDPGRSTECEGVFVHVMQALEVPTVLIKLG